jgi:hypothetical protein
MYSCFLFRSIDSFIYCSHLKYILCQFQEIISYLCASKLRKSLKKEGVVFLNTNPFFLSDLSATFTLLKCEIISWDWYYNLRSTQTQKNYLTKLTQHGENYLSKKTNNSHLSLDKSHVDSRLLKFSLSIAQLLRRHIELEQRKIYCKANAIR